MYVNYFERISNEISAFSLSGIYIYIYIYIIYIYIYLLNTLTGGKSCLGGQGVTGKF